MHKTTDYTATMTMPVERISGVWRFERHAGTASVARSPAGHLFHYLASGEYDLQIGRHSYRVIPGDLIYYASLEEVRSRFPEEVLFYSVAFEAAEWEAPPAAYRVLHGMNECETWFIALEEAFRRGDRWEAGIAILRILQAVRIARAAIEEPAGAAERWRRVVQYVKLKRLFHPDTAQLCRRFHVSPATLLRDCRKATGMTPMHYFKLWRLEEARALLRLSDRNVTEIAADLGYQRIHEFSREFSAFFGYPPRDERHWS